MSISTMCVWLTLVGQVGPMGDEPAGSPLQFNPSHASSSSDPQLPQGAGLHAPQMQNEPMPVQQPPASSSEYRSVFGNVVEATADSPPALNHSRPFTNEAAPAMLSLGGTAQTLLREALTAPGELALQGQPVDLKTLLRWQTGGGGQLENIQTYWRLTHAIAAYHWAIDEQRFLSIVPAADTGDDAVWLGAARASAKAERAESRLAAVRAQQALAELAPQAHRGELLLPADMPFVGVYRTHFKELNERGAAADDLRPIEQSLPVIREVIETQAEAVTAASAALPSVLQAHQQGRATIVHVLDAHQRLRRHRLAFLAAVEQYNSHIASYALSLSLPAVTGERIAGMLIETEPAGRSVLAGKKTDSDIQRVSNEEPVHDDPSGLQFRTPRLDTP